MKFSVVILAVCCAFSLCGQTRIFKTEVSEILHSVDSYSPIETFQPTENSFDFMSTCCVQLQDLLLTVLQDEVRDKDEFMQSEVLTRLAEAATMAWRGSQYGDKAKWNKLDKHFKRSERLTTSRFNFFMTTSFRIPLVDKGTNGFYYDRNGAEGQLNLFEGEFPKTEEEKEAEQIPLELYSEVDLLGIVQKELRRKGFLRDLKRGAYSYVGLSIEVDDRTLFRRRIPTARVVIILGAKRLRNVKVKPKPDQ